MALSFKFFELSSAEGSAIHLLTLYRLCKAPSPGAFWNNDFDMPCCMDRDERRRPPFNQGSLKLPHGESVLAACMHMV